MRTDPRKPFLAHYIAAVNGDRLVGDVARFVTAEPQNGIDDLFSSPEALHGAQRSAASFPTLAPGLRRSSLGVCEVSANDPGPPPSPFILPLSTPRPPAL